MLALRLARIESPLFALAPARWEWLDGGYSPDYSQPGFANSPRPKAA